jgi:hypothetical protein
MEWNDGLLGIPPLSEKNDLNLLHLAGSSALGCVLGHFP